MQLVLIASVLLLVSLASLAAPTPSPYFKLLFQDGYVIIESSDLKVVDYNYIHGSNRLFTIESQAKDSIFTEFITIKSDLVEKGVGFAIDSYRHTSSFGADDDQACLKNADEQLKHLIRHCRFDVRLRMLTEEEKAQIEQYKKDQQDSKKPFELLYDRTRVTSKAGDLDVFHYEDNENINGSGTNRIDFWTVIKAGENPNELFLRGKTAKLATKSFVIEGLPEDSEEKCGKTGLDDLILSSCTGRIKVRSN